MKSLSSERQQIYLYTRKYEIELAEKRYTKFKYYYKNNKNNKNKF